ncbi:MAG: histidine kinase [Acidobacteriota bacterium]|nr:histidine kinase [Acidobacteriota bacterium]
MLKLTNFLSFLILLVCFTFTAIAQYRFDQWTEENGLPQNWIKGIQQTRDGYLWLTTGQGVARFDGVRFKTFNRSNTPELTSDRFSLYVIHEDRAGNLWMGTEDGGVIKYRDGVFTAITFAQGLPGDSVVRIDEDGEGAIWIFTTTGLARWKNGNLTKVAPAPDSPFNEFMTAPQNFGAEAKYLGLWRRDVDGWKRFAYGEWKSFSLPPNVKDPAQIQVNSLVEDVLGRIWYSLRDRPGEFYRVENGNLTTTSNLNAAERLIYEDRQGRLWLNHRNGSLAFSENNRITALTDLPKLNFNRVLQDREGTIWIATESRGLYRLKPQVVTVYLHPGGTQYNNIQPLMQDRSGNIWVGSGGLARFDDGRFENFYHQGLSRSPKFERNVLISLFEDTDGSFWLGVREGIVRFRNGRLEKDEELSAQIKGWVHAIHRDRTGDLWFGSEEGLYCLRDGKLTRYGIENGLASPHIRVIHQDKAGTLWIGTVGGLARLTENGFYTLNESDGVIPARISSLYEDSAGFLWVGTYDGVLYRIKNEFGKTKVVRYATEQGLPYDAIHKILEDDNGFFWIGGQRGIYRIRRQELEDIAAGKQILVTVTRLGKDDGLRTPSCNSWGQPAGFKSQDGRLWFPTEEGIAVIDPKDLPFNSTPPPVLIEESLIDREPVTFESGLQISPNQENLEINYIALSFIKPEQIRFKYKLEGLDKDWVEAGSRRTAYYSHLPPGEYTFRVIAANSDGVWNETGKSLSITVLPPFYRTWWFTVVFILAISGAAFVFYKIRISRIERARLAQEEFSRRLINAHEAERRRIAAELHDSIGQTLAMIKNRAVFGAQTTENLQAAQEQLNAITAQTTQAIGEVREISYNLRPYLLDNLGLTRAIKSLVNKIEEVHLLTIKTQICDMDNLFSSEAEISVYRIIQESLNNIAKHAEADEGSLTIEQASGFITIKIEDKGRGFDKQAPHQADAGKGGFGLLGIAERVKMLGGTLDIESAIGKGTKLIIKIPKRENERING